MKKLTYLKQTLILLLWIVVVVFLFRFVESKKIAAVIAGLGFLMLPLGIISLEIQKAESKSWMILIGGFQFLLFFAAPIFFLRLAYWELPFEEIYFYGLPATELHRYSNASYLLLVGVMGFKGLSEWHNKKR